MHSRGQGFDPPRLHHRLLEIVRFVVFDIDGTLADCSHRLKYLQGDRKDWDSFFQPKLMLRDPLIQPVSHILQSIASHTNSDDILLLTARPERTRKITVQWLEKHNLQNCFSKLLMRKEGDRRRDDIVKSELLISYVGAPEEILMIFEDREHIVKMWRKMGIHTLHCAPSAY